MFKCLDRMLQDAAPGQQESVSGGQVSDKSLGHILNIVGASMAEEAPFELNNQNFRNFHQQKMLPPITNPPLIS